MLIKSKKDLPSSEITHPTLFRARRKIIKALLATLTVNSSTNGIMPAFADNSQTWTDLPVNALSQADSSTTPAELVKNYTNYYEFTLNKQDSTQLAQRLNIDPWSLEISGEVEKPGTFHLESIIKQQSLQEYIYRFRCVEAWSMVVPWIGFSLADLLKSVKPLSSAKFVKFTSILEPDAMPGQRDTQLLKWPYVEGLRIDEAMHPLTILAVGMYGEILPKQNGAPLRLIVPWKYGFKSIKAIVKIELLSKPPLTSWNQSAPNEYGFYANVNPDVSHPRWSQSSERLLGSGFFTARRHTELFNGYGEQVASLYRDMDLRHFF